MKSIGLVSGDHMERFLRYFDEEHNTNYSQHPLEDSAPTASRRESSGYTSSRHGRAGSIPEHERHRYGNSGQAEDEENESRTARRRSRNASSVYAEPEHQVNQLHSAHSDRYGYYDEEGSRGEQSRTPVATRPGSHRAPRPTHHHQSQPGQYPPGHY